MATNNSLNNTCSGGLKSTGTTNINTTGSGATTIGSSSSGAVNIASNSACTVTLNNQNYTLTTGTGSINIGTDSTTKTTTFGSSSTSRFMITSGGLLLDSGTGSSGNFLITKEGTGSLTFSNSAGTFEFNGPGNFTMGTNSVPTAVNYGATTSSNANSSIGSTTGSASTQIDTGTGTINLATAAVACTVTISQGAAGGTNTFLVGTGGFILPSMEVTGVSQAISIGISYTANNALLVVFSLPTTAAQGTTISIAGNGAGGWKILQAASQFINSTAASTTTGVTGFLASGGRYDCVELVCNTTNNGWTVQNYTGTLTFN